MASESLSFDIFANDRASETFRRLGLAADNASGDVKTLGDRLDKLGTRVSTARVGLEGNKEAGAELDKLDVKLIRLGNKVADPNISVEGKIKALAEINAVDLAMDKLNRKTATVNIAERISKAGFLKPSLGGTALALSPALIPLSAGIAAGIGAIGVSFGAATIGAGLFGLAAKSVLASASTNLAKLQALELTRNKATTAAAKKSADAAIAALKASFAPGYLALLDQLDKFKTQWTTTSQAIAVPALSSWLTALTKGMPLLVTAVKPVADVFKNWGDILSADFANPAVMRNLQGLAAEFGKFSAGQLNLVGRAIGDMALGVFHLGQDFAGSGGSFASAGVWFANMGTAFLGWSKSAAARNDVQGFLKYLHDNGGTVKSILSDLGKVLPGIFAGASTAGQLELKAISGFLGLIAKLPKGWQAPLTEAAGAMLLLSKTGVLKVGFTVAGAAAGWVRKLLGGASVEIGGTAAAAEMRAAMVSGGTAAAAEIRAAMAGGGAVAGGEGAAAASAGEGAAAGGAAAGRTWGAAFLSAVADIGIPLELTGLIFRKGGWQTAWLGELKYLASQFKHLFIDPITRALSYDVPIWVHTVASIGPAVRKIWDALRRNTADTFDSLRHNVAAEWDSIWNNTTAMVRAGVGDVTAWFRRLPGNVLGALRGLGHSLYAFAHAALSEFWNGLRAVAGSVFSWVRNFVSTIWNTVKKFFGISSPSSLFYSAGKNLMLGLFHGIKDHAHTAVSAARAVAHQVGNVGSGVRRWAPLVSEALRFEGLSPSLLGNVLYQMQTESGGNPNAINLTDSNAAMGDPSRGLMQTIMSTFQAYHWPGTSSNIYDPLANIAAALNYARHVYGPSLMSGGMGIGSGHGYAAGSWAVPYTGPATVHKGEMIIPARAAAAIRSGGGGNTYNINVHVPVSANKADTGRQVVEAIREFERRSGSGWRS